MVINSNPICPFTYKSIVEIKQEDLAVIYETNPLLLTRSDDSSEQEGSSRKVCTLVNLVSYLHNGSGGTKLCPVSQSPISVVCDLRSSNLLTQLGVRNIMDSSNLDENGGRIVSFRYGTISYCLAAQHNFNALDRISHVLQMDVKSGMKVIHKGKIIYPTTCNNISIDDVSEQLLDISASDIIHRRKKPSLVVIGLRSSMIKHQTTATTMFGLIFSISRGLSPTYLCSMISGGVRWTLRAVSTLANGMFLFLRSIFYSPQHQ